MSDGKNKAKQNANAKPSKHCRFGISKQAVEQPWRNFTTLCRKSRSAPSLLAGRAMTSRDHASNDAPTLSRIARPTARPHTQEAGERIVRHVRGACVRELHLQARRVYGRTSGSVVQVLFNSPVDNN